MYTPENWHNLKIPAPLQTMQTFPANNANHQFSGFHLNFRRCKVGGNELTCCPPLLLGKLYGPSISSPVHPFKTLTTPWPNLTYHPNTVLQGTTNAAVWRLLTALTKKNNSFSHQKSTMFSPNATANQHHPPWEMGNPTVLSSKFFNKLSSFNDSKSSGISGAAMAKWWFRPSFQGLLMLVLGSVTGKIEDLFFGKIYHQRHWYLIIHCQLLKDLDAPYMFFPK